MSGGFIPQHSVCQPSYNAPIGTPGSYDIYFLPAVAPINTKGSWNQLTAATPNETNWVSMAVNAFFGSTGTPGDIAFDIGIGAGGSERTVLSNLIFSASSGFSPKQTFDFPLDIPAGSRVAIRLQETSTAGNGGTNFWVVPVFYNAGMTELEGASAIDGIYGSLSAAPYTVQYTAGASGVFGSYTQIVASTLRDYIGFFAEFDQAQATDANFNDVVVHIAIGASGSEEVLVEATVAQVTTTITPFYPIKIPAGSRLAVRGTYGTAISGGKFGINIYGVVL